MIRKERLYSFLEHSFHFILVVDGTGSILHASGLLQRAAGIPEMSVVGRPLREVLTSWSLNELQAAMEVASTGGSGNASFVLSCEGACPISLRSSFIDSEAGPLYFFVGGLLEGLGHHTEHDMKERYKELCCLYATAEWIEASRSVREFFTRLPEFLAPGMQYPDETLVWSEYQGQEWGQRTTHDRYLSTDIIIHERKVGEIRVGYRTAHLPLLPEERRLLAEIARMLNLALDRKELSERLSDKQEELEHQRCRLDEMEREIGLRMHEMDEQRQKLSTINSYLERANQDWEESRRRLETIFQAIPDRAALIDRNRNLVITNRGSVQAEEKCFRTFFGRDSPCKDCRLSRIIVEKTPITMTIQSNDRYLEARAMPVFNAEHEVDGIMEFYKDVTLERTYEQQLRQADKLASLGQLVSGIGHEINNPNQFIRGNIRILTQAMDDLLPIADAHHEIHPEYKVARLSYDFFRKHIMTLLSDMAHGSERIQDIVEGLRRFARKDEGLLIDTVDINTLIQATARLVHNEVHRTADLRLDLGPSIPSFTGNTQKIEQVLVNLVVNAAQAMPEDRRGTVTVRTRQDENQVVIEVVDDGKGMNEKTRAQIFDPFFTTKRAKGGTGLGLAIAYRIVEEHRGTISVSSEVGIGTTFRVRLPIIPPPPDSTPAA